MSDELEWDDPGWPAPPTDRHSDNPNAIDQFWEREMLRAASVGGQCPMGCGQTLANLLVEKAEVNQHGYHDLHMELRCQNPECPQPRAVHLLLDQPHLDQHLVNIDERSFTLQHPLYERLGGVLFKCPILEAFYRLQSQPAAPGIYLVAVNGSILDLHLLELAPPTIQPVTLRPT